MSTETDQLASDYTFAAVELAEQTTQVADGIYKLNTDINFEEFYPNGVIEFLKTEAVKEIADNAGVIPESILPPITITDSDIDRVNEIFNVDFLQLSSIDKTLLSSEIKNLIDSFPIPTQDQIIEWATNYSNFVIAASEEQILIPSIFREIQVVSTDVSLDSFIKRTNTQKVVIIGLNKLSYPFISQRFKVPGVLQATLIDAVGLTDAELISYSSITKKTGSGEPKKGNSIIITNNAKDLSQLKEQKTILNYIDETSQIIRINDPLLFDLDGTFTVKIHQFSKNQILSPGELIKIPK